MIRFPRFLATAVPLLLLVACSEEERGFFVDPATVVDEQLAARPDPETAPFTPPPTTPVIPSRRAVQGFIRRGIDGTPTGGGGAGRQIDDRPGDISLDFRDADLPSVIEVMMQEALDANYVLDPRVNGEVTIRTNRPLRRDEVLPTLEEILRLNGAAIVFNAGVYTILPIGEAGLTAPLITFGTVAARGLTVRVTPLRFVTVEDVSSVLENFTPVAGSLRYDSTRNLVFSIGTAAEQATLMEVIATLDVDFLSGRSFALRPLASAGAQPVADELAVMFARPSGAQNTAIRFVPIERMNAIMVVSDDRNLLEQAMDLVRFLDQDAGETPRLHVFYVSNRRAGEIASLLGQIFDADVRQQQQSLGQGLGGGVGVEGASLTPGLGIRRDSTIGTSGVGFTGTGGEGRETAGLAGGPGRSEPDPGGGAAGVEGGGLQGSASVFRIVADEASNALVALATADGARAIGQALKRLDVKPLQVMIEATLVEVALNDELEFGVRWFLQSGNFNFNFGDALGTGAATVLPGFNAAFQTNDVDVTLSALDEISDIRLLSSPTLMVMDNQIARLQVGDQVPISVRSSQSVSDPDAPIVEETEFRDTGVILEIRPTVDAAGTVMLEIRQEVSDVLESAGDVNPTFAQRVIESTISVQSGETVALAGLIEEGSTLSRDGIPVLSRIGGIGPLFGTTRDAVARSELLVLIRPIVVRDQAEARRATEELRRKLIGMAPTPSEKRLRLSPDALTTQPPRTRLE